MQQARELAQTAKQTQVPRHAEVPKAAQPAGTATHRSNPAACMLNMLVCLLMTAIPIMLPDCAFADDSADILPPIVSVVSPDPGADLYSPPSITIEVEYTDLGSGVDPATAYLFVNEADATSEMEASEERAVLALTGLR